MITINPARTVGPITGPIGIERSGQGCRLGRLQRAPVRCVCALRAGVDRWRGLVPTSRDRHSSHPSSRRPYPDACTSRGRSLTDLGPRAFLERILCAGRRYGAHRFRARISPPEPWSSPTVRLPLSVGQKPPSPTRKLRRSSAQGFRYHWPGLIDANTVVGLHEIKEPARDPRRLRFGAVPA